MTQSITCVRNVCHGEWVGIRKIADIWHKALLVSEMFVTANG